MFNRLAHFLQVDVELKLLVLHTPQQRITMSLSCTKPAKRRITPLKERSPLLKVGKHTRLWDLWKLSPTDCTIADLKMIGKFFSAISLTSLSFASRLSEFNLSMEFPDAYPQAGQNPLVYSIH